MENDGYGFFKFHRIGDFPGAYSPLIIDLDNDGDMDIVTVSGFNDWEDSNSVSLMSYLNYGDGTFETRPLALMALG